MTLDSKLSKAVYQGNGSTTVFPFAFRVWDTSHIAVTMTDEAGVSTDVTSNSTVTLTSSGGSVAYPKSGSPLPSGAKLAITRNMPFTQGINLTTASRFDPQVLEDGLDQATAERQQILEQMARAVILPPTSSESPEDVVQSIYASRDAAAASATAASAQATAAEGSAQAAANSATTAAQTVETATADAISAATAQANAAHDSALAAAQSAADAEAAVPDNLVARVTAVEDKNTHQDTRLEAVETKNTQQDTALSGKANQAMDNLTQAGTTAIAHAASPTNNRTVSIAIPAEGIPTSGMPGDGCLKFAATSSAAGQYIRLYFGAIDICMWSSATGQTLAVYVPCAKNQQVYVAGTAPTSRVLYFTYYNGAY